MKDSRREFIKKSAIAGMGLPVLGPSFIGKGTDLPSPANCPVCIFSKHLQFLDYDYGRCGA